MSTFRERLRSLREARGLPCATLSELCGLCPQQVGRYESGRQLPSLAAAVALADFFNVSLDYLVGRADDR